MVIQAKSKEELNELNLITIENFRLLDDDFMRIVFQDDLQLAQFVLRIITGIDDLVLSCEDTQYELKRHGSRSVVSMYMESIPTVRYMIWRFSVPTQAQSLKERGIIPA